MGPGPDKAQGPMGPGSGPKGPDGTGRAKGLGNPRAHWSKGLGNPRAHIEF